MAVLLSGGVDSSLALRLLQAAGHACTAFYLQIWFQEDFRNTWDACPWEDDLIFCRQVRRLYGQTALDAGVAEYAGSCACASAASESVAYARPSYLVTTHDTWYSSVLYARYRWIECAAQLIPLPVSDGRATARRCAKRRGCRSWSCPSPTSIGTGSSPTASRRRVPAARRTQTYGAIPGPFTAGMPVRVL